MNKEFRAHPLMIISLMKPFLFILIFPIIKGVVQYVTSRKITGILALEITLLGIISAVAGLRCLSFRIVCKNNHIIIQIGVFLKSRIVIKISKLSSIQTVQNPVDTLFNAVTYKINTEAGHKSKSDYKFKLSKKDSFEISKLLYGDEKYEAVKFSVFKVAFMAATTSSAVTGMIIGVPIINRAAKLLGVALNDILIDRIESVSDNLGDFFPPVIRIITLLFLFAYAISFLYYFFKYINFKLFLQDKKIEVRSGFFVRTRTAFKKDSVNDVIINQTPLMRLFGRYGMTVSVGGYGNSKKENAVIVPYAKRAEIKEKFKLYFPFLTANEKILKPRCDNRTKNRFLFFPTVYFVLVIVLSIALSLLFKEFANLILFLTVVISCIIIYYAYLRLFEFYSGGLCIAKNIYAKSVHGFKIFELYCPNEKIGEIKIIRSIPDLSFKTCKVTISVHSESADQIKIRNLEYDEVKKVIYDFYGIRV